MEFKKNFYPFPNAPARHQNQYSIVFNFYGNDQKQIFM